MGRRRIYDSDAIDRDDDDPFRPGEQDTARRSFIDWTNFSHALMPVALRNRAIRVDVRTSRETIEPGERVDIRIELFNRLPFPVVLRTRSAERWIWSIDGHPEASHVRDAAPDGRTSLFEFGRRERKVFRRRWSGRFRTAEDSWELASPGEYEITAAVNVDGADRRGLEATTVVSVE